MNALLPLLLWMLGQAKNPRVRKGASWVGLAFILLALAQTSATVVTAVKAARLTLGFLGGIHRAWYAAYNGSQHYTLEAARQLGGIARLVATAQTTAAEKAFDAWLVAFDPLGIVRDKIKANEIEPDPSLFQEVTK